MLPDPPQDHFNYDELEGVCTCPLCRAYETTRDVYLGKLHAGIKDRELSLAQLDYLAASNKRDLYSELSWLTAHHISRPHILSWVMDKIKSAVYRGVGWWAIHSERKTLEDWLLEWQKEMVPFEALQVSGVV